MNGRAPARAWLGGGSSARQKQQPQDQQRIEQQRDRQRDLPQRQWIADGERRGPRRRQRSRRASFQRKRQLFGGFEARFRITRDQLQNHVIEPQRHIGPPARGRDRVAP